MFGFEGAEPPEGRWAPRRKAGVQQTPGRVILDSSMVEHSAVNRVVVGSSPTRGGKLAVRAIARKSVNINVCGLFSINVKPRKRHNGSHKIPLLSGFFVAIFLPWCNAVTFLME